MIKVSTQLEILEIDRKEVSIREPKFLFVDSYWNGNDRVTLTLPDLTKITILACDLRLAIENAVNKR